MATLNIDVMTEGGAKFYRTVKCPVNPLFRPDLKAIERYVHEHCPLLKYEKGVQMIIDYMEIEKVYGKRV